MLCIWSQLQRPEVKSVPHTGHTVSVTDDTKHCRRSLFTVCSVTVVCCRMAFMFETKLWLCTGLQWVMGASLIYPVHAGSPWYSVKWFCVCLCNTLLCLVGQTGSGAARQRWPRVQRSYHCLVTRWQRASGCISSEVICRLRQRPTCSKLSTCRLYWSLLMQQCIEKR